MVAIRDISDTTGKMSEIASTTASAVEEQGAATQEISRNVKLAAQDTMEVSSKIIDVQRGVSEAGSASSRCCPRISRCPRTAAGPSSRSAGSSIRCGWRDNARLPTGGSMFFRDATNCMRLNKGGWEIPKSTPRVILVPLTNFDAPLLQSFLTKFPLDDRATHDRASTVTRSGYFIVAGFYTMNSQRRDSALTFIN